MYFDSAIYRLNIEYAKIQKEVFQATNKTLNMPNLSILPLSKKWGTWSASKNLITLSDKLIREYEWAAVVYVFRHEVAHQIVNHIFNFDGIGCPHGEHFSIACNMLGISDATCASSDFLKNFKGMSQEDAIVEKVRKLYIKGNDKGATEAEQVLFMNKACYLMDKYNINLNNIVGSDTLYLERQVTEGYDRFPTYLHDIGAIMSEFYHVQTIQAFYYVTHTNANGSVKRKRKAYMKIFGEATNLDVAEYVFHALLNQGELLYKEFKKNRIVTPGRKISKASYFRGLMNGYKEKMKSHRVNNNFSEEEYSLLHMNDKILKDLFEKEYRVRYGKGIQSRALGYSAGQSDGKKMNVSYGVKSNKSGYLLC